MLTRILSLLFAASFLYSPADAAPHNTIETLKERMNSVVSVRGQTFVALSSPQTQAAIDPQTGRVVAVSGQRLQYRENKGAGVIISADGRVVTNTHVVFGSNRIVVALKDGTEKEAQVLYVAPADDFCILKIDPDRALAPVAFADSSGLALGDEVTTIGHSDFLNGTISGGVISGLGTRETERGMELELLRININHYFGDSGGPVFDRDGRLVGLMSAKGLTRERQLIAIPAYKIQIADINLANATKSH